MNSFQPFCCFPNGGKVNSNGPPIPFDYEYGQHLPGGCLSIGSVLRFILNNSKPSEECPLAVGRQLRKRDALVEGYASSLVSNHVRPIVRRTIHLQDFAELLGTRATDFAQLGQ